MPRLDVDTVMSTIDRLLVGAMDEGQMQAAAEAMRQLFNGSKACFAGIGPHPDDWASYATDPDEALQERCTGELAPDFIEMGGTLRDILNRGRRRTALRLSRARERSGDRQSQACQ